MMMMMMMMKTNTIMNTLLIIRYYYIVWINYIQLYTSIMLATPMLTMDDGSQDWLDFRFLQSEMQDYERKFCRYMIKVCENARIWEMR